MMHVLIHSPDFQYPYSDERGLLFIALWFINASFGLSMIFRAYRIDAFAVRKMPGLALVGLYLFLLSCLSFQSVLNYLGLWSIDPVAIWPVIFLLVVVLVGGWAWRRWRREGLVD